MQFDLKGDGDTADTRVAAGARRRRRGAAGASGASASPSSARQAANHALDETIGKDFSRAERLSVPLTFVILLLAFGAFVAAGVPVLLALSAVLGIGRRSRRS